MSIKGKNLNTKNPINPTKVKNLLMRLKKIRKQTGKSRTWARKTDLNARKSENHNKTLIMTADTLDQLH